MKMRIKTQKEIILYLLISMVGNFQFLFYLLILN